MGERELGGPESGSIRSWGLAPRRRKKFDRNGRSVVVYKPGQFAWEGGPNARPFGGPSSPPCLSCSSHLPIRRAVAEALNLAPFFENQGFVPAPTGVSSPFTRVGGSVAFSLPSVQISGDVVPSVPRTIFKPPFFFTPSSVGLFCSIAKQFRGSARSEIPRR